MIRRFVLRIVYTEKPNNVNGIISDFIIDFQIRNLIHFMQSVA